MAASGSTDKVLEIIKAQDDRQQNLLKAIKRYVMCDTNDAVELKEAIASQQSIEASTEALFSYALKNELRKETLEALRNWLCTRIGIPLYQPSWRVYNKTAVNSAKSGATQGLFGLLLGAPAALGAAAKFVYHQGREQLRARQDGKARAEQMLKEIDLIQIEQRYEGNPAIDREINELGVVLPEGDVRGAEDDGLTDAAPVDDADAPADEQVAAEPVQPPEQDKEDSSLRKSGPTM